MSEIVVAHAVAATTSAGLFGLQITLAAIAGCLAYSLGRLWMGE